MPKCIVCKSSLIESFYTHDDKKYWRCSLCLSKFIDKRHHLNKQDERGRYLEHKNFIKDPEYRNFLSKLSRPLIKKLKPFSQGMDYGCGPGPALADMLIAEGFIMDIYDPFFFPNLDVFSKKYEFITCTETAEHFYDPHKEFINIDDMLLNNGWVGLMTNFLTENDAFDYWYYRRDPTHVVFYSEKTFEVIADQRNWSYEIISKNVVLFNKQHDSKKSL